MRPNSAPESGLGLLKPHYGRAADGTWTVQDLIALRLQPRPGCSGDFFPISDELVVQRSLFGTIGFLLAQSIVPIVAHIPGEHTLRCLGTGFFISCSGLLITAAHVITDPIERRYGGVTELDDQSWFLGDLKLGVMIPLNPLTQGKAYIFRDIEWAAFLGERAESPLPITGVNLKLTSDTAVCKVAPIAEDIPHQPLTIVQPGLAGQGMAVAKAATAIGYGEMRNVELTEEPERVVSGDFPFSLHASTGPILERFPDNLTKRHVSTPGACFSAAMRLPPGMSGSPIFDHEGIYVHGVVSKGWDFEPGVAALGYGSMLAHSVPLPLKPLGNKSLLDLQKSGDHGLTKLSGPGL